VFIMNLLFQVPCSGASSHSHLSHPLASAQSRRSSRSYPSYRRAQLSRIHVCLLGAICSAHSETTSIGLTSMGPWPYSTYRLPVDNAPRSRGQAETEAGLGLLQAAPSTFRAYTARRRDARRSPTASLEATRVMPGEDRVGGGDEGVRGERGGAPTAIGAGPRGGWRPPAGRPALPGSAPPSTFLRPTGRWPPPPGRRSDWPSPFPPVRPCASSRATRSV